MKRVAQPRCDVVERRESHVQLATPLLDRTEEDKLQGLFWTWSTPNACCGLWSQQHTSSTPENESTLVGLFRSPCFHHLASKEIPMSSVNTGGHDSQRMALGGSANDGGNFGQYSSQACSFDPISETSYPALLETDHISISNRYGLGSHV